MAAVRTVAIALAAAWAAGGGAAARPLTVRVQWGGGAPQAWAGTVELVGAASATSVSGWRTLSVDASAAAHVHEAAGVLHVHQPRPMASDGVELVVDGWRDARLRVALAIDGGRAVASDVPLAAVVTEPVQQPLDALGNRLTARLAPDDALHVEAAGPDDPAGFSSATLGLVHLPGERLRIRVEPLLPIRLQGGHVAELRLRLEPPDGDPTPAQVVTLASLQGDPPPVAGPAFTEFEPVVFDVSLPAREGVSTLELQAVERGGLRWARPLATRRIEIAAVAAGPVERPAAEPWRTVYEFDPGGPRLIERLRRLPGMSLPAMPLPEMPLPSLTAAAGPLSRMPSVPLPSMPLPGVPVPNVSAIVPRMSGPLAHGHSTVASHPLGPMLRLPPAVRPANPPWEGFVLAGLQPGLPHMVEIEYPTDQDATVGVVVLEPDAAGVVAQHRHAGGFEVARPRVAPSPPARGVHRFVFWPTTRQPVVVIANASSRTPAIVGRLRVRAGPSRLAAEPAGQRPAVLDRGGVPVRRRHAFLDTPDIARGFGGGTRFSAQDGRPAAGWEGQLAAARRLAEAVAAQGGGGTLLTAFAEGGALWPSAAARHSPRWDAASAAADRDLLSAVARLHARHGLALVPAARFDAPLPAVEAAVAEGGVGGGLVCVGRDGAPRRTDAGCPHYNPLHPVVQRAVEQLVVEMASRLRGSPAVTGVALVLPRDGWLHLPGLAWPLDDWTFARFAATLSPPPATGGEGRFVERARLVEGPLREAWIAWRCDEIAGFHARLAAAVAAVDPAWSLHIVPTTLFLDDRVPAAGTGGGAVDDRVRQAGLDPAALRAHPEADRIVHAWPRVHAPTDDVRERAAVAGANRSADVARAAAASRRRSAVLVERPLAIDVDDVVPHAPFSAAKIRETATAMPAETASRALAEALAMVDAEAVFDGGFFTASPDRTAARAALEAMPVLESRGIPADAPLAVRTGRHGGLSWTLVVNLAAAPVTARLHVDGRPSTAVDAADGVPLALAADEVLVPLPAWGMRCMLLEGDCRISAARAEYDESVRRDVAARVDRLRRRRLVLETPAPLEALDNPAFEVGPAEGGPAVTVAGWELVEPRRGALALVPGAGGAERPGRSLEFSSSTGLATLRSNPFPQPATGRVSVAARLRVADPAAQPPLRIAIEGVQGDREYYRFAAIGGLSGGRRLTGDWSQYVLQVDDLPAAPVESLRVRFDLLGPGSVQIDDVRVFDLAFDESQRSRISAAVSLLEHQRQGGDLGGCLVGFEGHWPAFLEEFVDDPPPESPGAAAGAATAAEPPARDPSDRQAGGLLGRLRGWWQ